MAAENNFIGVILEPVKQEVFQIENAFVDVMAINGRFAFGPINKWMAFDKFEDFVATYSNEITDAWLHVYVYLVLYKGREVVVNRVAHYTTITNSATLTAEIASENFDDNEPDTITGTLDAGITSSDTSLTLSAGQGAAFPTSTAADEYILIGTEKITYTGKTTDTLTGLGRGAFGSVAAAHSALDVVTFVQPFGLIVEAKYPGALGNQIGIEVFESTKLETTTTIDLADGGIYVDVNQAGGIKVGEVLAIGTTPLYVQVTAVNGNRIYFDAVTLVSTITSGAAVESLNNTIDVYLRGTKVETFINISMWSENVTEFVETVINNESNLIKVTVDSARQSTVLQEQQLKDTGGAVALKAGSDGGAIVDADYVGSVVSKTGLYAFDDYKKPLIIIMPDATSATVQKAAIAYAASKIIHFFVVDIPAGLTPTGAKTYADVTAAFNTDYACAYWPRVKIQRPDNLESILMHTSSHVVGKLSEVVNTLNAGPWQTPAGTTFGQLRGVTGVEEMLLNGNLKVPTQDPEVVTDLQESNINSIIIHPQYGVIFWGSRTFDRRRGDPNANEHVNQKHLERFITGSIQGSLDVTLFRNNDFRIRNQVLTEAKKFFSNLFKNNAFPVDNETQAYHLVCDNTNNSNKSVELVLDGDWIKPFPINRARFRFFGRVG